MTMTLDTPLTVRDAPQASHAPDAFQEQWDEQEPPNPAELALQDRLTQLRQQADVDDNESLDDFVVGFRQANCDETESV